MIYEHTTEVYFDTDGVLIDTKGQFDIHFDPHDGAGANLVYWFCEEWKPRHLLVELVGEKRVQQLEDLVADQVDDIDLDFKECLCVIPIDYRWGVLLHGLTNVVHWFVELMARHPEVEFFQPSPGQALGMFKRDYRMEYY